MDLDAGTLAIGAAVVVAVGVLAVGLNETLRNRARIQRRVAPLGGILDAGEEAAPTPVQEQEQDERNPFASLLDKRYPLSGGARTGLVAAAAGLVLAAALVPALDVVGMPLLFSAPLGILLGAGFGWNVGGVLEQRKRVQFNDRLLLAIEDFQRMVRFGISTAQALNSIASSAEEPVKSSLRRVAAEADFGVALGVALGREAHRVGISELAMLAAIISTQSRTGGGLAESVGNLAEMLRERIDNRSRVKAATSESKISLIILSCVPFAAIGIQSVLQPDLVDTLVHDARHLLGIGAGMIVAGLAVAWFLVRSAQK